MKNLKPTKEDSFLFYKEIVDRRNNPKKAELIKIELDIKKRFKEYKYNFDKNNICKLKEDNEISENNKKHLKSLYSMEMDDSVGIGRLRKELTTNEKGRVDNICQFCTFEIAHTLDHFLPKSVFQEYSVNPLNLFPMCSKCNIKKSNNLTNNNGECLFLNLYTDILPEEQYLFVNLEIDGDGDFIPNFYLENIDNKINIELFGKIKNHYKELDLLNRFIEQSSEVIEELKNSKKTTELPRDKFIEECEKQINSKFYNINDFKVILKKSYYLKNKNKTKKMRV